MQISIKERIESVIKNLDQLPSIPDVASKIIDMVNDPDVDFKLVAREISRDQAITTNLLKLCNSAYFSKGKEITSIDRAVAILGIKEVKDVVFIVATKSSLNKIIMGYDLAKGMLWEHGLAVAMLSKKIAIMKNHKAVADIAFTGGIIHDIGKTVLALFVQATFKDIMALVESKGISFQEAEKEIMGFDHQEIGEIVLNKWKFPEILKMIVRYHHQPDLAPAEYQIIVSVVHIANILCMMGGIGIGSDGLYYEMNEKAVELLKFTNAELEQMYSDLPELLKQTKDIS